MNTHDLHPGDWIDIPPNLAERLHFNERDELWRLLEDVAPLLGVSTPSREYERPTHSDWSEVFEYDDLELAHVLSRSLPLLDSLLGAGIGGERFGERVRHEVIDPIPDYNLLAAIGFMRAERRPNKGESPRDLRHFESAIRRELAAEWSNRLQRAAATIGKRPQRREQPVDQDPTPEELRLERRRARQSGGRLGI